MNRQLPLSLAVLVFLLMSTIQAAPASKDPGFTPLFPRDGVPEGWVVRYWGDISKPPPKGAVWKVEKGVLRGSTPRGTWLVSEKEYGDFELKFDFKLGKRGNSGCALRSPMRGDPAFDGLELQMADLRYNPQAKPSELTGGLYRAAAPAKQVYKPETWNSYHITLIRSKVKVALNGTVILDIDLNDFTETVKRHDGSPAPPLKDRPRRGHIGFQELSRNGDHVQIRNARMKVLGRP